MPVETDLMAGLNHSLDHLRVLFGDPTRGEKRGVQAEPSHQFQDTGCADIDLKLASRARNRFVQTSHDPRRIRVHVVSEEQARLLAIRPDLASTANGLSQP